MDALSAAAVIMGFNFAFSFVSVLNFYRGRVGKTPVDQRSALTPTLVISLSFLLGLISSLVTFYSFLALPSPPAILPPSSIDALYPWNLISELAMPLFGFALLVAVVGSLRRPRFYALPVGLLAIAYALSLLSPKHPLDDPYLSIWVATVSLLLLIPMVLFGYLWRRTKRKTALGMFLGLIIYYAYFFYYTRTVSEYIGYLGFYLVPPEYFRHVALYQDLISLMPMMIFIGVASLSLIYWFFQYSERKIGGEIIGYTITMPVVSLEIYILLLFLGAFPFLYVASLVLTTIAAMIFILGGSYVYGRYRESRSKQTLALSLFSFFAGLDFLLSVVGQDIYALSGARYPWFDMIALPVGMLTGGFLFVAAMYALDRKSLILAPALVIAPLVIISIMLYPMPVWFLIIMAAAGLAITVTPGAMFGVLLRRMSKAKERGRGRVLGIFIGFLFLIFASPLEVISAFTPDPIAYVGSLLGLLGAVFALLGALIFFLGVSGRFDRWFYERRKR
ncbi:MAG: hypothetical protein WED04_10170 [Promethearchaeati archaeon SRVP18_Atabeyarchaeia-1]